VHADLAAELSTEMLSVPQVCNYARPLKAYIVLPQPHGEFTAERAVINYRKFPVLAQSA
jgi:hypothetical protein